MPNWTQNRIHSTNRRVIEALLDDSGCIDFGQLIPMPKELDLECGSRTCHAIVWYLTDRGTRAVTIKDASLMHGFRFSGRDSTDLSALPLPEPATSAESDRLYRLGALYVDNIRRFGAATWYEWCTRNWGSKWNAVETRLSLDGCSVRFETAWTPPLPVFDRLCALFPDEEIFFDWIQEEDLGCLEDEASPERFRWYAENEDGSLSFAVSHCAG